MDAPRELGALQQWMQAVITHAVGPDAAPGAEQIESIVTRGSRQTSLERVTVYANAYYARLMQCLRELFPAARAAVGDEAFDDFALGYLQAWPPRSYTLGRLADHFVEYLEQSRGEHDDLGEERRARRSEHGAETECAANEGGLSAPPSCSPPLSLDSESEFDSWSRFVIELARFEQAIDEVFDGPGLEGQASLLAEQLADCSPEALAQSRLVPAPCLRLLRFAFPVNDYFSAYRRGESPDPPAPQESFVALHRVNYAVRRHPLTRAQFLLLSALVEGRSVEEAIESVGPDLVASGEAPQLREWFAAWAAAGFFERLEISCSVSTSQERPHGPS